MQPPSKLLNKNFFLLWQGQLVSQLGDQAFAIALLFWLKHATGSATVMGMVMMVARIPSVLLGPLAGTFADRHNRRLIIILCDIINGVAVTGLALLLFWQPDNTDLIVGALFVVSLISSTAGTFFRPAISAAIPDIVPTEKLAAANSMNQFSMQAATFFGQGAGGVLYRLFGAPLLFLIDGLTFLFSAVSEMFIRIPQTLPEKTKGWRQTLRTFTSDLVEGLHFVWRQPGLRMLFFAAGLLNFFFTPIGILLPFYVEDFLHARPDWFGYIIAAMGAGSMVGFLVAGGLRLVGRTRSVFMLAALTILSLNIGVIGMVHNVWMALGGMFVAGIAAGFFNIGVMTILQLTTPSEIRGRVFGLLGTLATGLTPIAMGLAGIVADLVHQNIPLIFMVSGGITVALSLFMSTSRAFREYLAFEPASAGEHS